MLARQVLVLLTLGTLCSEFVIGKEIEKQILDTVIDGKHVVVPFFEAGVDSVTPEQKKIDLTAWDGVHNVLLNAVEDLVIKKKSYIKLLGYPKILLAVLSEKKTATAKLVKSGKALKKLDGTTRDSMSIYSDMKEYSKQKALSSEDQEKSMVDRGETAREFMKRFVSFLNIFEETLQQSPVGSYLQWRRMTIDGVPVAHEAAYFYDYFKNNGFSKTLWLADQAIALLEKVGGL